MMLLALATAGMNASIFLSGVARSPQTDTMKVVTGALSLGSAILFYAGLAPPAWLLDVWRRPEGFAFQAAMGAMLRAESQSELSDVLLPRAAALVGASGAALVLPTGEILGRFGSVDDDERIVKLAMVPERRSDASCASREDGMRHTSRLDESVHDVLRPSRSHDARRARCLRRHRRWNGARSPSSSARPSGNSRSRRRMIT